MRKLKDWLSSYLEFNETSESPELFHFWAGVSTIAGALRRRVWIDMLRFEWTPNFYIVLVAPPGVASKSTTIGVGSSMLREIPDVHFGPDSGTWQAIGKALEEAREMIPISEGDLMGDFEEMSCITCTPGELGTFLDFQDRKLVDVLTSLWDGQRTVFEHRTATSSNLMIKNPWINLISGTTPAWLRRNVPEEAIGGGFASRCIFVFAQRKRKLVAYPGLVEHRAELDKLRLDLVSDLGDISNMFGAMQLSPDALVWGENWYANHHGDRPIHMSSDRFDGYMARKQTHIHKLAIVLSAAESSDLWVEEHHLANAEKLTTSTEQDMIKVFESIGVAPTAELVKTIVVLLDTYQKQGIPMTQKTLYRHCFQQMSQQEFTEAIEVSIKSGYIQVKERGGELIYELLVSVDNLGQRD